jgi:hypothetical protein
MRKTDNLITSDTLLNALQQAKLAGLLDVIIPEDKARQLPSAGDSDLGNYINEQSPDFIPGLVKALESFSDDFAELAWSERYRLVQAFSGEYTELFNEIIFHTYACYYQNDLVRKGLDLAPGPPFPRGNEIKSGDLSLLDEVLKRPPMYRTWNG